MDTNSTPPYVQVIETHGMTPSGEIIKKTQVLREGETIVEDGHRFLIVKNSLGTLYKKSLDPLGQVGNPQPVTVSEFTKQSMEVVKTALERQDKTLHEVTDLLVKHADEESSPALHVQNISSLFKDRFGANLTTANANQVSSVCYSDGNNRIMTLLCGSVRVHNQNKRNKAINHLLKAVNDLADRGWVPSILAPLSSMVIGRDEVIFYFIHVPAEVQPQARAMHLDVFLPEGDIPTSENSF